MVTIISRCDACDREWEISAEEQDGRLVIDSRQAECEICKMIDIFRGKDKHADIVSREKIDGTYLFTCGSQHTYAYGPDKMYKYPGCPVCKFIRNVRRKSNHMHLYPGSIYMNASTFMRWYCELCNKDVFLSANMVSGSKDVFLCGKDHWTSHKNNTKALEIGAIIKTKRVFEVIYSSPCEQDRIFGRYEPTAYNPKCNLVFLHHRSVTFSKRSDETEDEYIDKLRERCTAMDLRLIVIPKMMITREHITDFMVEIFSMVDKDINIGTFKSSVTETLLTQNKNGCRFFNYSSFKKETMLGK